MSALIIIVHNCDGVQKLSNKEVQIIIIVDFWDIVQ